MPIGSDQAAQSAAPKAESKNDDGIDRKRLLAEFEQALMEDATLSAGDREVILRTYEQAMENTPVQLGPPNLKELQADFAETVNRLAEMEVIDGDESVRLVRELTDALQPLEDGRVEMSMEYMRRLNEDGIEAATAWLKEQTGSPEAAIDTALLASKPSAARTARRRKR